MPSTALVRCDSSILKPFTIKSPTTCAASSCRITAYSGVWKKCRLCDGIYCGNCSSKADSKRGCNSPWWRRWRVWRVLKFRKSQGEQ
ncbi:Protein of unknown function [Pyronema omphalodes CBS 100304]|uniref:Uncharacterized protein n=1 Tax=Pyronema omphalodes (strain CBS 100304) TaxID=1076935 RepID=U4LB56_PYROM|nr:Protein of unknown function [Pyronema omphalodes CBS 100304]